MDNLILTLSMENGKWQAVLESDFLALGGFIPYPVELDFSSLKLAIDKVSGELKPLLHLSGNGGLVENYNGSFLLRDTRGEFSS